MLEKDPGVRPLVDDVVKSDYVKGHISRLLSHTLKVGNGGATPLPSVASAAAAAAAAKVPLSDASRRSVEELERQAEDEVMKQRREIKAQMEADKKARVLAFHMNYEAILMIKLFL